MYLNFNISLSEVFFIKFLKYQGFSLRRTLAAITVDHDLFGARQCDISVFQSNEVVASKGDWQFGNFEGDRVKRSQLDGSRSNLTLRAYGVGGMAIEGLGSVKSSWIGLVVVLLHLWSFYPFSFCRSRGRASDSLGSGKVLMIQQLMLPPIEPDRFPLSCDTQRSDCYAWCENFIVNVLLYLYLIFVLLIQFCHKEDSSSTSDLQFCVWVELFSNGVYLLVPLVLWLA